MKIKKTITALCLTLTLVFGVLALSACSGGNDDNDEPGFPKHNISVQSDAECALSVDKTQAEFGETVTVTVDLKTTDKYIDRVTYNGQSASKRSETTYDFLMGNDDVVVKAELVSYVERTKDGFANYLLSNPKTLAKNNGEVDLSISLNASYMSILYWNIQSTNQAVIPGASVNEYSSLNESGAISARKKTASASNLINGLTITIDTDKISNGTTYLLIDFVNGNSSSQKASLVIPITVTETIVTEKWQETLTFDVSALSRVSDIYGFNVHLSDQDYVSGSDNKDYQKFENLTADANKVAVTVEYVPGHRYYVTFEVMTNSGISFYKLGDSVGQGSTSTGFNQLKDGLLTFISNGSSLTITVLNETI